MNLTSSFIESFVAEWVQAWNAHDLERILMGLSKNTQLNFKVLDILKGVNGISIYYINTATKKRVVEMMQFNDSLLVERAIVHYSK